MKKLLIIFISFFIVLFVFHCNAAKVSITVGQDPFSPKPGQKDAYESDDSVELGKYLNHTTGTASGSFASGGGLYGFAQFHSFHNRDDQDWFQLEVKQEQRAIVEIFNATSGISAILQLFYKDGSGNLVKIWGTDSGLLLSNPSVYDMQDAPSNLSGAANPTDVSILNQRVFIKRKNGSVGTYTYYLKVTIPPFLFREGKDANYMIRARGSGDYRLDVPVQTTATRDLYSDRVNIAWKQATGATSYRVVRAKAQIPLNAECPATNYPCNDIADYPVLAALSTSYDAQVLWDKKEVTVYYQKKQDRQNKVPPPGCDPIATKFDNVVTSCDILITNSIKSGKVYSDSGNWVQTSQYTKAFRCASNGFVKRYQWQSSLQPYKTTNVFINDANDPNSLLPNISNMSTSEQAYYEIVQGSACESLPFDKDNDLIASNDDNPLVGEVYNYVVYACDDILQTCSKPSYYKEPNASAPAAAGVAQANDVFSNNGGGSLQIFLPQPEIVYVSNAHTNGIWVAWKHVNSNKKTGSVNKRIRYSLQRSNSPAGPFTEVECQINVDGGANAGSLLKEYDDGSKAHVEYIRDANSNIIGSKSANLSQGTSYYYKVVAQQLRDSILCDSTPGTTVTLPDGSTKDIPNAPGTPNRNCETSMTPTNGESRKGSDGVVPETDEDTGPATNDANDNNCDNDSDYFNPFYVAEGLASESKSGSTRFLANWAMCFYSNTDTRLATANIKNDLYEKSLTLNIVDSSGTSPASDDVKFNLVSGTYKKSNIVYSTSVGTCVFDQPTCSSKGGTFSSGSCAFDQPACNALVPSSTTWDATNNQCVFSGKTGCNNNGGTWSGQQVVSSVYGLWQNNKNLADTTNDPFNFSIEKLCNKITSLVPNISCTTACNAYGPNNFHNRIPVSLLKNSGGNISIPADTANDYYGSIRQPFAIESRVFATQGYYENKIKLHWPPIQEANGSTADNNYIQSYEVYRTSTAQNSNIPYIYVTYHGSDTTKTILVDASSLTVSGGTQNFALSFSDAKYNTVREVVSAINRKKGFSAYISNPDLFVKNATNLSATAGRPTSQLNLKNYDVDGRPMPVILYANVKIPIFNTSSSSVTKLMTLNKTSIHPTYIYDDNTATSNILYYYMVRGFKGIGGASTGNAVSYDFIPATGWRRDYGVSIANNTYDDLEGAIICGTCSNAALKTKIDCFKGNVANTWTKGVCGMDIDEYDFSDPVVSKQMQYALDNSWNLDTTAANEQNFYGAYAQRDNDSLISNTTSLDPYSFAEPSKDGEVFKLKMGTHTAHAWPTVDAFCSIHESNVNHGTPLQLDHDSAYSNIGYAKAVRANTYLPCSFQNPGTDITGKNCTGAETANAKWAGDPDVLYDDNSGTGFPEPLNVAQLTFQSPFDVDWVWFFAQKKYYDFSQYSDYIGAYVQQPGTTQNSFDAGCWPRYGVSAATDLFGPFFPTANPFYYDGGGAAAGAFQVLDTKFYDELFSRPCSNNTPILDGGTETATGSTAPQNNGDPRRAYQDKFYRITYKVPGASNNFPNTADAPIIIDFYTALPNLNFFNGSRMMQAKYDVAPRDTFRAPFYSARLEPAQFTTFKLPSSFNARAYSFAGGGDYQMCSNLTNINISNSGNVSAKGYGIVENGVLKRIQIIEGGSGYVGTSFNMTDGGGVDMTSLSGSGAAATFYISGGKVTHAIVTNGGTGYGENVNKGGIPPCIAGPRCNATIVNQKFTKLNGSSNCAKFPYDGLKLCMGDKTIDGLTAGDSIYEVLDVSEATSIFPNVTACIPSAYYKDTNLPIRKGPYWGNTCDAGSTERYKCPPPGMHILMRVYSPDGNTGTVNLEVLETTDPGPNFDFCPANQGLCN